MEKRKISLHKARKS